VSNSGLWKLGEHFGVSAGKDLTGLMSGAPHGKEVFSKVPLIGTLVSSQPKAKQWFEAPIRIFGMSLIAFTGLLLGVFFVLNFATCFSMPWSKGSLPWKGSRPGLDPLDASGAHMHWTQIHKYFAWGTVTIGLVHGILGLMAVLGYHV
ncbi:MAG TPA: hypothetical protein VLH19_00565, partial [Patescibacteria group bacterium]|nr:hypothetical protein [Patescibacteria group bacterium]